MTSPSPSSSTTSRQMVLVFTDLVGSVALKKKLGSTAYIERIQQPHDELFRRIIAEYPGAAIRNDTGDGFLAEFRTSTDAVNACLRFQHALHAIDWNGETVGVRVGIHAGQVAEVEPDPAGKAKLVGLPTDLTARLMGLALPGQILLTRAVYDDARMFVREHPPVGEAVPPALQWLRHGPYLFKGDEEELDVFEVGGEGIGPLREPPDGDKARRNVAPADEGMLGRDGGWRPATGVTVPHRDNWVRRLLLSGGVMLIVASVVVAPWLVTHRRTVTGTGETNGGVSETTDPHTTPLKAVLDVRVWPNGEAELPSKRLKDSGVLPLKPGDLLRVEASVNRPAYLYLVWLDADGAATPLWPWKGGDWNNLPKDSNTPRAEVHLPEDMGRGMPLRADTAGVQVLMLMARETPLPGDPGLASYFINWPKRVGLDPLRMAMAAWFEDGEAPRVEEDRAPFNLGETQEISDPVWRARVMARGELRRLFATTRMVCFTFRGQ